MRNTFQFCLCIFIQFWQNLVYIDFDWILSKQVVTNQLIDKQNCFFCKFLAQLVMPIGSTHLVCLDLSILSCFLEIFLMPQVDDIQQNLQMSWLSNMYQEHKLYLNMNTSANKCLSICTTKGSTNITQLLHIWHTFLLLYHQHTLHKSNFFFDLFPCKPKRNPAVKHNTLKFSPKNIFG